jgi:hypothetical protein
MMEGKPGALPEKGDADVAGYEPPRIESVLTADDVEREALYGGISLG